jgi:hypothetical protein
MRALFSILKKLLLGMVLLAGIAFTVILIVSPIVALLGMFVVLVATLLLVLAYIAGRRGINLASVTPGSSLPASVRWPVAQSRRYGRLMMKIAQQYPPGPMQDRLKRTVKPVNQWLENLNRLEQGLAKLYSQRNLPREMRQMTFEIEELHRRWLVATDKEAAALHELMESKKQHLVSLKELRLFQTQAELKIRKIANDLGMTHAEMLLLVSKGDFNDTRIQRMDKNLQEHVDSLRDMLVAMDELGYRSAAAS